MKTFLTPDGPRLLILLQWLCLSLMAYAAQVPIIRHMPDDKDRFDYAVVHLESEDPFYHDSIRLHLDHGASVVNNEIISWELVGQIGDMNGHYLFRRPLDAGTGDEQDAGDDASAEYHSLKDLRSHPHVRWAHIQKRSLRQRKRAIIPAAVPAFRDMVTQLDIHDPGFVKQWHLYNLESSHNDINVTDVWKSDVTGKNVVVAIIDDGIDFNHEDLRDNFFANGSYDFNTKTALPLPRNNDDFHGTRCAGEIAAVKNGYCGVGVAHGAKVAGIRILGGPITDVDEALALNYGYQENHIYSCSWGPEDDGSHVEGPNELVTNAIINGINKGRNGLGSIFVFATGNGGYFQDNCNYDGYTNSMYTITISAIDAMDQHPIYSEQCSAHLASTYSSGSGRYIYTTDIQPRNCTARHGGTSAAAPIAGGILALALSVRPDLSWRDAQHLTIRSAVPMTLNDEDWQETYAKRMYSHKFGYGKMDAWRLVEEAKTWKNVNPQVSFSSPIKVEDAAIPQDPNGLQSVIPISAEQFSQARMARVEHVTVIVNITHQQRGDLDIWLISPHGIKSHLGPPRVNDRSTEGFRNWTFMTVKHWEEDPIGNWTLFLIDNVNLDMGGMLHHWQLSLYGEAVDDVTNATLPILAPVVPVTMDPASEHNANAVDGTAQMPASEAEGNAQRDTSSSATFASLFFFALLVSMGGVGAYFVVKKVRYRLYNQIEEAIPMHSIIDPQELKATFILDDEEDDVGVDNDGFKDYPFIDSPVYNGTSQHNSQ